MQISLSYANIPPVEVPDSNLIACLEPKVVEPSRPVAEQVEQALEYPIGSPPLEQWVTTTSRVLILVDDITRQTPAWAVLPGVLSRLAESGCGREKVKILIAAGTHARMTAGEVEQKLGKDIAQDYSVTLHHWKTEDSLKQIGVTADGTPVFVNRMLAEADFVIGIGQIVPHRVMGYTGGATIVQPGVSGPAVTGYTHWMSALYPGADILGVAENPVRLEVERIARQAGLRFIVNVIMDAHARVLQVVAGDPVAAHRVGAEHSRAIYGVSQPELADVVLAESYPADYDLWQASKGMYSAELAVRPGGVVILVTPCPHGVSDEHPEVERVGYHGLEDVKARVARKEITDLVAAAHLVHVGRVICDRAQGIMVSPGIGPVAQRSLGLIPARTPQEALELALAMLGQDSKVVVLRHGGDVLPQVTRAQKTPEVQERATKS